MGRRHGNIFSSYGLASLEFSTPQPADVAPFPAWIAGRHLSLFPHKAKWCDGKKPTNFIELADLIGP